MKHERTWKNVWLTCKLNKDDSLVLCCLTEKFIGSKNEWKCIDITEIFTDESKRWLHYIKDNLDKIKEIYKRNDSNKF